MSEQDTEIENDRQPQFGADAFAAVLTILAAAADPKATARHVRQLESAKAAADAALADLAGQSEKFRAYEATTRAELEAKTEALGKREVALHVAEGDLKRREVALAAATEGLSQREMRAKRRLMALAGIEEPGPLQDKPTWRMLANELLQIERDPHYPAADVDGVETVRPDFVPAASTLTQTWRSRRAAIAAQGA